MYWISLQKLEGLGPIVYPLLIMMFSKALKIIREIKENGNKAERKVYAKTGKSGKGSNRTCRNEKTMSLKLTTQWTDWIPNRPSRFSQVKRAWVIWKTGLKKSPEHNTDKKSKNHERSNSSKRASWIFSHKVVLSGNDMLISPRIICILFLKKSIIPND